jgi:hypothetical protein
MKNKKYELTKNKKEHLGKTLFQIKALIDLKWCKKGKLGGYIESEDNLEVYGNAWVSGNALVSGNARVYGNALVSGKIKLTSVLCSRSDFEFDWQVKLWQSYEKKYEEEVKKKIKSKK